MKKPLSKSHFLSIKQQKILLLMYRNSFKVNYKEQSIYKKERSFERAMKELCKQNIIELKVNNDFYNSYKLKFNGKFYVEHIILG